MTEFRIRPLIDDAVAQEATTDRDAYVVACAAELFLRNGISSVKMVDIAKAADVGVATVYRHFSTKAKICVSAATLLWHGFNRQIRDLVESNDFLALDGLSRFGVLLDCYCAAYAAHADFVAFVDEFDHLVLSDQLNRSDLFEYGAELDSFYLIFEDAYRMGRQDGSIARELDFRTFYLALGHALIGVAVKLHRGEIIPSDDFSSGSEELRSIVNMAMWSLAGEGLAPQPRVAIDTKE